MQGVLTRARVSQSQVMKNVRYFSQLSILGACARGINKVQLIYYHSYKIVVKLMVLSVMNSVIFFVVEWVAFVLIMAGIYRLATHI